MLCRRQIAATAAQPPSPRRGFESAAVSYQPPVQTLVDTAISFRVSRKRKEMHANVPGSSCAKVRTCHSERSEESQKPGFVYGQTSSLPRMRSLLSGREETILLSFACPKERRQRKRHPGGEDFGFFPSRGPPQLKRPEGGLRAPFWKSPRAHILLIRRNSDPLPIWRGSCRCNSRFPDSPLPRGSRVRNNRAGRLAIPADSHGFACCSSFSDNQPL